MYGFIITRDGTYGTGDESKRLTRVTEEIEEDKDNA